MILPCTSPPNAIYANMKARKLGVAAGLNGRTASRSVRPFWPVINNADQYGQTRPLGETERPDPVWPMKKNVPCVNMHANSQSQP